MKSYLKYEIPAFAGMTILGGMTILLFLLSIAFPQKSEARIYVSIDQVAEKKFPLAILPAANLGEYRDKYKWGRNLPEILKEDLELSGIFDFVSPETFPAIGDPKDFLSAEGFDFNPWTILGIQAILTMSYSYQEDNNELVSITLRLLDPFLRTQIIGKNYTAVRDDIATVAHHFADEVMQALTGERGIFSTKIVYISDQGGGKDLYVMDIDGGHRTRLTQEKSILLSPDWSPDGRYLAYMSYKDTGQPNIRLYNLKTGKVNPITANDNLNLSPTWDPSGRAVTFVTAVTGDTDIISVNLRGELLAQLTQSFGIDINPSWAPDGRWFVFASERAGKLHLFKADSKGQHIQRLTYAGYHNDAPAWSPRGDKIAFQSRDEGHFDIFIMNPDGTMIQRLTANSGDNEGPSWSPNGRYLTFSSTRTGREQIFIMKADGDNQRQIETPGRSQHPDWSPYF